MSKEMITVALVGLGPRGLTVFDRLIHVAKVRGMQANLTVHIVEPGEPGQGAHPQSQPRQLIINTVSGMITMSPPFATDGGEWTPGPSFPEWARQTGYRRFDDDYAKALSGGEEITDLDYLPRWMLGEYLSWYYDEVIRNKPDNISVVHHRERAVDVRKHSDEKYDVYLESGFCLSVRAVILATGHNISEHSRFDQECEEFVARHAPSNNKLKFIRNVYPLERLNSINPQATVAVQGMGLTAHDVISQLTYGRGGRYLKNGDTVEYLASGREPKILLFSRSALPSTSRAKYQKQEGVLYKAEYFTKEAIERLRSHNIKQHGTGQLDFDKDVFPLLLKEMGKVFRSKSGAEKPSTEYELTEQDANAVLDILYPIRDKVFSSLVEYQAFFRSYLQEDLLQARQGNVHGAAKATMEVIRDSREAFRAAVEYAGLTPQSHERFNELFVPMQHRVVVGVPEQRNVELIALLEAGIVSIGGGPGANISFVRNGKFLIETQFRECTEKVEADALIVARLDKLHLERDSSPLFRNMSKAGLIQQFRNQSYEPGGIEIDDRNHPIGRDGKPVSGIWLVGYPVEGPHYFTNALPLPLLKSRHVTDADKCVREFFETIVRQKNMKEREVELAESIS